MDAQDVVIAVPRAVDLARFTQAVVNALAAAGIDSSAMTNMRWEDGNLRVFFNNDTSVLLTPVGDYAP